MPDNRINREQTLKEIGKRLIKIRKKLNLTQKQFAESIGISIPSLSEIESGKTKPGFKLIFEIKPLYGVNLEYLLYGQGEMFEGEKISIPLAGKDLEIHADWLKDFVYYFINSPIARYHIVSYFSAYLISNKEVILKEIEENKEKAESN